MFLRVIAVLFLVSLAKGANFNQQEQIQQASNDNAYVNDPLMSGIHSADAILPRMPIGGYGLANDFGFPSYAYGLRRTVMLPAMASMYGRSMAPYSIYSDPMMGSPYMGSPMMTSPYMGDPMIGSPYMGTPFMGSPMMASSPMIGAPIMGPQFMEPSHMSPPYVESTFVGSPVLNSPLMASPMMGAPMMGAPMMRSPILGTSMYGQPVALYDENEPEP